MAEHFPCAKCQVPSTNCCSKCRAVYYCSRDHQKADWAIHKTLCVPPFKIDESEHEGRYLVAKRSIKAGEIILQEPPLVLGPKLQSLPLCLGCYKHISGTYRCSRCNWPMCSALCEESAFHRNSECRMIEPALVANFLCTGTINNQVYQCITPLRCLSLSAKNRQVLDKLVSHMEQRKGTDIYRLVEQNISSFLRQRLKLTQYDSEHIQRVCGILETNCFEIRIQDRVSFRGLYPTASLMNHECVPNTRHVFDPFDFKIRVLATRNIRAGEKISATYTQIFWNTIDRRLHLKSSKHFWCQCSRCADPRELGTLMGALKCTNCGGMIVSNDPLDQFANWECSGCGLVQKIEKVKRFHDSVRAELKQIAQMARSRPELLENFIATYSGAIHPGSCHVIEAKYAIIQLYGNASKLLYDDLNEEQIGKKLEYCNQLLKLADFIDPGLSQLRGHLLFELQSAMEKKASRSFERDSAQFKEFVKKAADYLVASSGILRHEIHWVDILERRRLALENILKGS
ncbi:SET domain-containing protein SmydA-8-like isoform X1 [Daphnia carinata]|uniref:SET domain-containing protein SmydA-8-like isoform X1 n=1 Tax=Daphnia carinata TaxID=120202 RepID=UPI002579E70A|nr:SET domain-containing protein SmydA-8-like isoform X1 [Daphnia carinata]